MLLFADDGVNRKDMEEAVSILDDIITDWGLTISVAKTKLLIAGINLEKGDLGPLCIKGQLVDRVLSFRYLSATVEASGSILLDMQDKIG